jgi:hypothetical protein
LMAWVLFVFNIVKMLLLITYYHKMIHSKTMHHVDYVNSLQTTKSPPFIIFPIGHVNSFFWYLQS